MKTEYAQVPFEVKEIGQDDGYFRFSGYASTKDVDLVGDIVEPGAFNTYLSNRKPTLLWQHDRHEPLGVFDQTQADEEGLFVKGRMPLDDTFVRDRVMPQMKIGSIKAMSIGFRVVRSIINDKNNRVIQEAELPEISLVTFPANEGARVLAMKSIDDFPQKIAEIGTYWDQKQAEERIQGKSGAYLYENGTEKIGLLADMIDGEMQIVPKAVFEIRARLSGVKGGLSLSDTMIEKAKCTINALYDKMGIDIPFAKTAEMPYTITEIKGLSAPYLSAVLRGSQLSKGAADYIAALVFEDQKQTSSCGQDETEITDALTSLKELIGGA